MLAAPAAAEEVLLQEENAAKRNKKEKKKNSSGRLELGTVVAGGASNKGEWRDTLLRSIAAFLESNGFARTLSTFQSEASIEFNHQKTSAINLEDLLCKFFESSNDPAEKATIVCLQNQGNPNASVQTPGKSINTIAEQYPKKKRKKTDEPAKNRFDEGCSESVNLGEITDGTSDEFHVKDLLKENGALKKSKTETKEKKRKKKSASDLFGENSDIKQLDGTIGTSDTTDLELENPCESKKESKKKKHKNSSDVAMENVEIDDHGKLKEIRGHKVELRSLTNGSSERKDKTEKKKEKKVKDVQPEVPTSMTEKKTHDKLVDAENSTLTAVEYSLNDKDSQRKEEKKKCNLTPEGLMEPGKLFDGTDAKKKNDIQQDVQGIDLAKASTPVTGELDSKVGKKNTKNRKRASSAEEKDNLKPNNGLIVNMKTDETNADVGQHLLTKKLKREEGKGSDKLPVLANAEKGVDEQIPNGSVPDNNMEEKETNKDKKSKEPKSVTPFQRVKVDEVKFADQRLQDNSYWAKGGADSGYGAKAQEVLGQVRGRDFRHEKTKKKRGTYRGGLIDLQSHSIKFTYSDED